MQLQSQPAASIVQVKLGVDRPIYIFQLEPKSVGRSNGYVWLHFTARPNPES